MAKKKKAKKVTSSGVGLRRFYYFLGFTVIAFLLASQITYTQEFGGTNVLGDESAQQRQEQQQEQQKQQAEAQQQTIEQQNKVNVQKNETEVQTANGVKVKTKIEDNGTQKIEAESSGVHFKFEQRDGETKLEAVNDDGKKLSTESAEVKRLEQELEDKDIAISSQDGVLEVEHNGIRARTSFPLSINQSTGQLIVTTPEGQRTVAVLPDDAIKNMLSGEFLTTIASGSGNAQDASGSGAIAASYQISMHDGTVVYEIAGAKEHKLFGLFPVTTEKTVLVSAQDGQAVSQSQSWLATIISFLSF